MVGDSVLRIAQKNCDLIKWRVWSREPRGSMSSVLFSKFKMRGLELGNRIVVSPMGQYSAENGCATDWHMMHLGHLSVSGAALLITEATAVENARPTEQE